MSEQPTRKGSILEGPRSDEPEVPKIPGDTAPLELGFGLATLGTSGLKHSGGLVYEEFLQKLQGSNGVRLYAEMEKNSAAIGAIRQLVRDLARQVKWEVVPNEKSRNKSRAKEWAEYVEGCRGDMEHSWADLISEALSMIEYGFAPTEITYKLRRGRGQPPEFDSKYKDGRIGWRCIEARSQDTLWKWEFSKDTNRLCGMWQNDFWADGRRKIVFIPIERIVLFRTESTKNNPEGRSLFRNAVDSYLKLRHVQTVEMIGVERDLTGLPVMEVPLKILEAGSTDPIALGIRRELEKQLGSLKRHEREFLILPTELTIEGKPTGYKFRLQQSPGAGRIDVSKTKNDYKTDIFQSCLAQFLQLGQNGNGGSRALSEDATDLFSLTMYALLESLREAFQRQAIDRLCTFNNVDDDDIPQLSFGDIDNPNLAKIGAYITALNQAGVLIPDKTLRRHLYGLADLPFYDEETDVITADELVEAVNAGEDVEALLNGTGKTEEVVDPLDAPQLTSLMQIVDAMIAGKLPKDAAATIMQNSLGMDPEIVEGILGPVEAKLLAAAATAPIAPGMPGAQPPQRIVQPNEIGDPTTQGEGPGGVKLADQIVDEVLKHVVKKGIATLGDATRVRIERAARGL